jgi:phosphopantetheinyl transferase (holo-ACP synthase)
VSRTPVGNDVVDLDHPATRDKAGHERFLERVLAPAERAAVSAAEDPHLALWTRWAAKEAAYKVVSKLQGRPPVFAHRAFVTGGGAVEYEGTRVPVHVTHAGSILHVVASLGADPRSLVARTAPLSSAGAPWDAPLDALLRRFTTREAEAVHTFASAAARLGARAELASMLGVEERRLEIVCAPGLTGRRPPLVLLDGAPAPADVSLSHHGRWIAWALFAVADPASLSPPSAGS